MIRQFLEGCNSVCSIILKAAFLVVIVLTLGVFNAKFTRIESSALMAIELANEAVKKPVENITKVVSQAKYCSDSIYLKAENEYK